MFGAASVRHDKNMPHVTALKLLVVDDHAAFRAAVRQVLDELNAVVIEAASGEEALSCFESERPDWVVMDLRMPGMGGLKATEAIRRIDPGAHVVMMSQFHGPEFAEQAQRAGAVGFVNKEDLFRLHEIIRRGP